MLFRSWQSVMSSRTKPNEREIKHGKNIQDWDLEELQVYHPLIEEDIYIYLRPETAVQRRNSLGGTGFEQVKYQIEQAKKKLKGEN